MWFVFPQVAGLGFSAMSQRYAIASRAEAQAYLAHPLLGPRLAECTSLVLAVEGRSINAILGAPDDAKFRSSMTLFGAVSGEPIFGQAIARYFAGERDGATLDILEALDRKAGSPRPPTDGPPRAAPGPGTPPCGHWPAARGGGGCRRTAPGRCWSAAGRRPRSSGTAPASSSG